MKGSWENFVACIPDHRAQLGHHVSCHLDAEQLGLASPAGAFTRAAHNCSIKE
jgi:hypothetical protein